MSRLIIAAIFAAAVSAAGCGDDTPTAPTPNPTIVTDPFSGTLTRNGAATHIFSVNAGGTVSATLTSVSDPNAIVGLSLGALSGTQCAVNISNDSASQGAVIAGSATGAGTLCARVYDVGKLSDAVDYQITVTHY
jgi:hypothetical protein